MLLRHDREIMLENTKYRIMNIILLDSQFKRIQIINLESPNIKNNVHIEISSNSNKNILSVYVTLKYDMTIDDVEVIKAQVSMIGIFECSEDVDLSIDTFGKINGPAIIFPFIREHLATLSMKAGVAPIILPPVNFVQLAEQKKSEETKIQ